MKMKARIPRNQAMNQVEDKEKRKEAVSLFGRKDLIQSEHSERKMSEAETESRESGDENMEMPKDSKYEMEDSEDESSGGNGVFEPKESQMKKSRKDKPSNSSGSGR